MVALGALSSRPRHTRLPPELAEPLEVSVLPESFCEHPDGDCVAFEEPNCLLLEERDLELNQPRHVLGKDKHGITLFHFLRGKDED
jgi:hypothetical protein